MCFLWLTVMMIVFGTVFGAPPEQPNIIVILADDLGYQDVSFNGCKDFSTPRIDQFAKEGVRFAHGYVTHSFCAPTRAGLMAGRYQQRFGFYQNGDARKDREPRLLGR